MSARNALVSRAQQQIGQLAGLPQARNVLLPELLAGSAGAPLEWARRFHRFFFDVADLAIQARGLLVLQDVAIGRPSPVLREIELWGATIDADDMVRMSPSDIARQVGIAPEVQAATCTEGVLFIRAVESAPCIDDVDLRRSITALLVISTTVMLARVAPYVRIGQGVVRAYRPSNALNPFAHDVRNSESARLSNQVLQ